MSRGGSYNGDCQEFFKESKLYISKQSQLIHELESKLEELSEQRWKKKIFRAFFKIISDSKIIYNLHKNDCSKIIVQAEYETEQAMRQQLAGTAETAAE